MMSTRRRLLNLSVAATPQVLASLQSFLIGVLIARNSSVEEFGEFGIAFAAWAVVTGLIRVTTTEIFIFQVPLEQRSPARVTQVLSASLALSCIFGLLLGIIGILYPPLSAQFYWLAFSMPAFVLLDSSRILLLSSGRAGVATLLDSVFVAALLVAMAATPGVLEPFFIQIAWAAAAAVSGFIGALVLRARFSIPSGFKWFRTAQGIRHYIADFLLTNSLAPIATVAAAMLLGLPGAAAIRATQMVVAPLMILSRGLLIAFATPARRAADHARVSGVLRISLVFASIVTGIGVLAGFALLILPSGVLTALLGDTAALARDVLPAAILMSCALGIAMGAGLGLRVLQEIRTVVIAKAVSFPFTLLFIVAGAIVFDIPGIVWGLAVGEALRAALSWTGLGVYVYQFRQQMREP